MSPTNTPAKAPSGITARKFLLMNAIFSLFTSMILLMAPITVAQLVFDLPPDWMFFTLRILGLGLLSFAVALIYLATRKILSIYQVMLIVWADVAWLVSTAVLLTFMSGVFTSGGIITLVVVAGFVGLFAVGQFFGAQKL